MSRAEAQRTRRRAVQHEENAGRARADGDDSLARHHYRGAAIQWKFAAEAYAALATEARNRAEAAGHLAEALAGD